jgi:acyl-homoserine lactone synthase
MVAERFPNVRRAQNMCQILYGHEHSSYSSEFDQMFKLRHQVFIQGRKWSLPSRKGYEIDQYDTDDAVYFITYADDGAIEGSVRLTPTTHSSLLADYFPHLVETGESPRSPHIYEATRYIVQPARKTREALRKAKSRILAPLVQWCIEHELTHFQTVIDAGVLNSFLEMSGHTRVLGLAHPFGGGRNAPGGGECIAIRYPAINEVLADAIAYGETAKPSRYVRHATPEVALH